MEFFTYIVRCADDTLYTGFAKNLTKRLDAHNSGKWAKYTRGRRPVVLEYFEIFASESDARKREIFIKKLSRKEKNTLIERFQKNPPQ